MGPDSNVLFQNLGRPSKMLPKLLLLLAAASSASAIPLSSSPSSNSSSFSYRCRGLETWGGEHTYVIPRGDFCSGIYVRN